MQDLNAKQMEHYRGYTIEQIHLGTFEITDSGGNVVGSGDEVDVTDCQETIDIIIDENKPEEPLSDEDKAYNALEERGDSERKYGE